MLTRRQFLRSAVGGAALLAVGGYLAAPQVIATRSSSTPCCEGERNEALHDRNEQRTSQTLTSGLSNVSTGNLAARLKVEGESAECDVVLGVEGAISVAAQDSLEPLSGHLTSAF